MTLELKDLEVYDDGVEREAHSLKGASGAERWMNCVGSSALIAALDLPQSDEPDYRREGIAGHEAAADCLARDIDSWEIVGDTYHNTVIDAPMASAIQDYLDRVRLSIDPKGYYQQQFFIEAKLAAPQIHEQMFGSVDFGALTKDFLDVTDLKMGEGIIVDPEWNAQMMYYAFMLIVIKFHKLEDDFPVRLTVVQPRAFSADGSIRDWMTTVVEIKRWAVRELLPAMNSTDDALNAGPWCRFCPAKLVCPLMASLARAAATYDPKEVITLDSQALGLSYKEAAAVKFYLKAVEGEVYRRLMLSQDVPHTKLVNKKAHRIWTETAMEQVEGKDVEIPILDAIKVRFGADAFVAPEVKSPAELEKLGAKAKVFVKEHAFMPVTGLTVALDTDKRTGVKVQSAQECFSDTQAFEEAETS